VKSLLAVLKEKLSSIRQWLESVLDDDDVMALMNLRQFTEEPILYKSPLAASVIKQHEIIEALLDPFMTDCFSLEAQVESLREETRNTEDLIMLRLDTARNLLLMTNTVIAIIAASFSLGGFIAGIFGMNVFDPERYWSTSYAFGVIVGATISILIGGTVFSLLFLRARGILL
jgi:magnesium transporter